jgi:hypothetical protein
MRYEFSEHEWTAIKPMLPNKPRGVRRVDDRRVLDGIVWVLRSGAPCPPISGRKKLQLLDSLVKTAGMAKSFVQGQGMCVEAAQSGAARPESQLRLMLSAPFRARATHVVQLGPIAIAYVHNQVVNDAGKVGDCLSRLASKTRLCGPARRSRCDRTGSDDAFPDHLSLRPVGCGHRDDLADRSCGCARSIAVPVERLLPSLHPATRLGFRRT